MAYFVLGAPAWFQHVAVQIRVTGHQPGGQFRAGCLRDVDEQQPGLFWKRIEEAGNQVGAELFAAKASGIAIERGEGGPWNGVFPPFRRPAMQGEPDLPRFHPSGVHVAQHAGEAGL